MNNPILINELNEVFALQLIPSLTEEELVALLAKEINHLVENDFHRLVTILYRIDVSEQKLKQLLKDNPGKDSGLLIARMMVERQVQKIKTREAFKRERNGEEEW